MYLLVIWGGIVALQGERGIIGPAVGVESKVVEANDNDGCYDGEETQPPHRE
jgi:hypothetical protein